MTSIDMKDVFQTLFAVAWADGQLREHERTFLADLVHRSAAGSEALGWFDQAPPEPDWHGLRADHDTAVAIVRHAADMAAADDTIQYQETQLLERLREQLGLSEQDFQAIMVEVEQAHA